MNETSTVKPDISQSLANFPEHLSSVAPNELMGNAANEASASVGALLRTAREKAGLSVGDVASRLRMGVKQVRALEDCDYSALPQGTFLRGFVRNFAKEVGVKPEQALGLLEETHHAAMALSASAVVMPSQQNISVPPPGGELATPRARFLIAVAIACLLLTVVWWWWEYVRPYRAEGGRPKVVSTETYVSVPIAVPTPFVNSILPETVAPQPNNAVLPTDTQIDANLPSSAQQPASTIAPVDVTATPSLSLPPPQLAVPAPAPHRSALVAGNGLLGLTFSDKSWVEVVDGTGKTVLDRTFKGGEAEEVIGRPPFTVVIGNAQATRMAYNGKEVDLAPHTRASVARMIVK